MAERIVGHVSITIQRLGIARFRHNRIRTHKPPQLRVIPSCVVVTQPLPTGKTILMILPGEALAGQVTERAPAVAAKRVVERPLGDDPAPVHDDAGRAQMVAQQVVDAVVRDIPAAPERDRSIRLFHQWKGAHAQRRYPMFGPAEHRVTMGITLLSTQN